MVRCGAATATGHRRTVNEDALLAGPVWFVVADGMGGHGAGDVASSVVVETFAHADDSWRDRSVETVRDLVQLSNRAVRERAVADGTLGMGCTLAGAVVIGRPRPAVAVFHIGDARAYRLADGRLSLLTTDHSHVQELVDAGELEPDQARHHPLRNVVTRAIGIDAGAAPDVGILSNRSMRLLLCSDGLSGELPARSIGRVLAGYPDPEAAADRLVELTLAGAARDNVTALVIDLAFETATRCGEGWSRCR
jgi:protein phosphatase